MWRTAATLAAPLGEKSGGIAQPDECESRYSGDSVLDYGAALGSVRRVWVGALDGERGRGVTLLVRRHDIDFDTGVRGRMSTTANKVNAIPSSLEKAVVDDPASVRDALDAARDLRRVISTDVFQVIGGTLTFSDTDGD